MLKLAVMISGGGTNLQALIDEINSGALQDVSIEIVISTRSDAYALERAKKHDIPGVSIVKKDYSDQRAYEDALLEMIDSYNVDLLVLAGCLAIIPPKVVRKYKNRIINIHPSLIPAFSGPGYYGLKVHEAALARGVKVTGATVHFVDEGTDTGPIILQKPVEVLDGDNAESLQKRVMEEAEWKLLAEAVRLIAQNRLVIEGSRVKIKE